MIQHRRNIFLSVLSALSVLFLLVACSATEPLATPAMNYETDPRILRGTWTGSSADGTVLTLDLKAKSPSAEGYSSTGTFKLGDGPELSYLLHTKTPLAEGSFATAQVHATAQVQQAEATPCDKAVVGEVSNTFGQEKEFFFDLCGALPSGSPPELKMTLVDRNGVTPVARDFVLVRQPDDPEPTYLVKGNIVHLRGVPYTYDGEFVFTPESHAIVQLWYSVSYFGDGPKELVTQTIIEPITAFPITFQLEGNPKEVFKREGDYYLIVGVFSGDGGPSGDKLSVGDLVNETFTPVEEAGADVTVEVTGLEKCKGGIGGSCVP